MWACPMTHCTSARVRFGSRTILLAALCLRSCRVQFAPSSWLAREKTIRGRVVLQRAERPSQRPPQRLRRVLGDHAAQFLLVEPQPHERIGGVRKVLESLAALADHADRLVL